MRIETTYSLGDVVWKTRTWRERVSKVCTVCGGAGRVSVSGSEHKALCPEPACHFGTVWVDKTRLLGEVRRLTIGQVRVECTSAGFTTEYMAEETGVGTGMLHRECDLHATREAAKQACADEGATLLVTDAVVAR